MTTRACTHVHKQGKNTCTGHATVAVTAAHSQIYAARNESAENFASYTNSLTDTRADTHTPHNSSLAN